MASFRKLLSRLGLTRGSGACAKPEAYTRDDHDRIYQEACDLISPYMRLHGREAPPAATRQARKDLDRGISLLLRVVEMNPRNWAAYWVMGKAHQALGQPEQACDAFGASFGIEHNNPDVAREYMCECLDLGRAAEGIFAAEHAVALKPTDAGLIANLAIAYLIDARVDDALATVNKSLALAPNDEITQSVKQIILDVQSGRRPQPRSGRELD
jgi:tetratricopeptide (TPR) repeat protein